MSKEEDPSTNRRDNQDGEAQEQNIGVEEEIEDGYQTPTSEEHRIPPVTWTPPPPPKKRKLFFVERRVNIRKVEEFDGRIVEEKDLEAFFQLIFPPRCSAPPPPRPSEPEPDRGTSPTEMR